MEHPFSVLVVCRLAKNLVIQDDDSVSRENGATGGAIGHNPSLFQGDATGIGPGVLSWSNPFVNMGRTDLKRYPCGSQKFGTSGGCRRQNEGASCQSTRF
jgi:hypothetical protein